MADQTTPAYDMNEYTTKATQRLAPMGSPNTADPAKSANGATLANGILGYEKLTQNKHTSELKRFFHNTLVPMFLILTTPNLVIIMWYTAVHCDGSFAQMTRTFQNRSVYAGLCDIWGLVNTGSFTISMIIVGYCVYALAMMKLLPGKQVTGPLTPKGNTPIYTDNGFLYFLVTVGLFWVGTLLLRPLGLSPSIVYDRFDEVLSSLNIFSLLFCLFLYFKGLLAPSSTDSGTTGNVLFDYYWGTELYPKVWGFDLKVFTNCRFGMMVWALLVCVFALKSYELHGFVDSMFVVAVLQLTYLTKFFWWESGYMRTIDIMLDRAGYYICWGCLVFVPGMYASVSLYMVKHPVHLGPFWTLVILSLGLLSIYINYQADAQKQIARYANGDCVIWGKKAEIIRAKYQLENGDVKESILLTSGFWGLARHFHYLPELMLAFCWSVPALFENVMPYSYFLWLVILLLHRSYRDDEKCRKKYGTFWRDYQQKVPHRIVPYLF
ncbi:7-dehydrocholesterol reductase-like [Gigantopelta aegis]|uniref:7-dehydrocholesterol reductase-like n=1 Tax=Gigantopelta aegis TaxID=1735272 RepID=UPI001B88A216|nr:7-dehydrocholesterol reductase-like [Gigantopelta aegis]XP_041357340.1 7-dehydrocholesterol reductase-like [Gigantopelta aegis]XP_041357341.1 7-dehydrocholesterol reductase-like [Gigantopelta aegis]